MDYRRRKPAVKSDPDKSKYWSYGEPLEARCDSEQVYVGRPTRCMYKKNFRHTQHKNANRSWTDRTARVKDG